MVRTVRSVVVLVLIAASLALTGGPASAVRDPADLRILKPASLTQDDQVAVVRLKARCQPGWEVLEALITVNQPQTFGERFFGLSCDGRWHHLTLEVESLDAPFVEGTAFASGLVLLEDPDTFDTAEAQDSETIRL